MLTNPPTAQLSRDEYFTALKTKMDAMKVQMLRDYEHHALTCADPVGCELRAWQAIFAAEKRNDEPGR